MSKKKKNSKLANMRKFLAWLFEKAFDSALGVILTSLLIGAAPPAIIVNWQGVTATRTWLTQTQDVPNWIVLLASSALVIFAWLAVVFLVHKIKSSGEIGIYDVDWNTYYILRTNLNSLSSSDPETWSDDRIDRSIDGPYHAPKTCRHYLGFWNRTRWEVAGQCVECGAKVESKPVVLVKGAKPEVFSKLPQIDAKKFVLRALRAEQLRGRWIRNGLRINSLPTAWRKNAEEEMS